jgi:hypothetical protein
LPLELKLLVPNIIVRQMLARRVTRRASKSAPNHFDGVPTRGARAENERAATSHAAATPHSAVPAVSVAVPEVWVSPTALFMQHRFTQAEWEVSRAEAEAEAEAEVEAAAEADDSEGPREGRGAAEGTHMGCDADGVYRALVAAWDSPVELRSALLDAVSQAAAMTADEGTTEALQDRIQATRLRLRQLNRRRGFAARGNSALG